MEIITFRYDDKHKRNEAAKVYEDIGWKIVKGSKESEIDELILMLSENDIEKKVLEDMVKKNIRDIFLRHLWNCIFDISEDIVKDDEKSSAIANFMENIADLVFDDKGE